MSKKYFWIILVIVLLIGSYFMWQNFLKQKAVQLPTAEQIDPFAGWKTYRNEKYGFELRYPNGFLIDFNRRGKFVLGKPTFNFFLYEPSSALLEDGINFSIYPIGGAVIGNAILQEIGKSGKIASLEKLIASGVEMNIYRLAFITGPNIQDYIPYTLSSFAGEDFLFVATTESYNPKEILSTFKLIEAQDLVDVSSWRRYQSIEYGFELNLPNEWLPRKDKNKIEFEYDTFADNIGAFNLKSPLLLTISELGTSSIDAWFDNYIAGRDVSSLESFPASTGTAQGIKFRFIEDKDRCKSGAVLPNNSKVYLLVGKCSKKLDHVISTFNFIDSQAIVDAYINSLELDFEVENIIFEDVRVGSRVGNFIVKELSPVVVDAISVPFSPNYRIKFSGRVTLSGKYYYDGEFLDFGSPLYFEMDEESRTKVPHEVGAKLRTISFSNILSQESVPAAIPKCSRGGAVVVIDNFERIVYPADFGGTWASLIRIVSFAPTELNVKICYIR